MTTKKFNALVIRLHHDMFSGIDKQKISEFMNGVHYSELDDVDLANLFIEYQNLFYDTFNFDPCDLTLVQEEKLNDLLLDNFSRLLV